MPITSQHVTGFVVGLGVAAAGFYVYKMNQKQVDAWLESQGIHIPGASTSDYSSMTLEELVRQKEPWKTLSPSANTRPSRNLRPRSLAARRTGRAKTRQPKEAVTA